MAKQYKDNMVTLTNVDCIEGMAALPEGLYGPIITSPPYNVGKEYEEGIDYGSYLKLLSDFYTGAFRVAAKGQYCHVVFAPYYASYSSSAAKYICTEWIHHVIAEKAGWVHQTTRIWKKDFATLDDKYTINTLLPKLEFEYIFTCRKPGGGKEKIREQNLHPRAIWDTTGIKNKGGSSALQKHTAAYPDILVLWLMTVYTDEGDTIIEPFAGSGTTLLIARKFGRKSIGFELSEEYFDRAVKNLSQQTMEQFLIPDEANNPSLANIPASVGPLAIPFSMMDKEEEKEGIPPIEQPALLEEKPIVEELSLPAVAAVVAIAPITSAIKLPSTEEAMEFWDWVHSMGLKSGDVERILGYNSLGGFKQWLLVPPPLGPHSLQDAKNILTNYRK